MALLPSKYCPGLFPK